MKRAIVQPTQEERDTMSQFIEEIDGESNERNSIVYGGWILCGSCREFWWGMASPCPRILEHPPENVGLIESVVYIRVSLVNN